MEQQFKIQFIKAAFDLLYFEDNESPSPYEVKIKNVNQIFIGEYFYTTAQELSKLSCEDIFNELMELQYNGYVDDEQERVNEEENRLYWKNIERTENFLNYDITKHIK